MSELKVGDRVVRSGPHIANGGVNYGDKECKQGDAGTIQLFYNGREASVQWEGGNSSRIVISSLSREEAEIDAEVRALFGLSEPCSQCGCQTNGFH